MTVRRPANVPVAYSPVWRYECQCQCAGTCLQHNSLCIGRTR